LCLVTSGGIPSIAPIASIAFGDGGGTWGAVPPAFDIVPPDETQTSLNNQIAVYPIDSVAYPLDPQTTARYTVTIPSNDLNGEFVSEAGLLDSNGNLCAIKTFLPIGISGGVAKTFVFDDEF